MATRTAEQKKRQAKAAYNSYLAECPSRQLLARISDKWVVLVLCALEDGPLRYSELAAKLAGVSQKMLTQTLRALERDGLVERTVTPSVPVRVDYELTALGQEIVPLQRSIKAWAEEHIAAVHDARARFDQQGA